VDDRVAKLWAEYEPRIQAAKAADNRDRHRFFSNLLEETIGDFPAVILTLERYLLVSLDGIFDDGEDDPRIPVLRFLWIVSPEFDPDPEKAMEFIRKNRKLDPIPYPLHIQKYMDDAFAYAPPQKAANSSGQVTPREWVSSSWTPSRANTDGQSVTFSRFPFPGSSYTSGGFAFALASTRLTSHPRPTDCKPSS